MSQDEKVVNNKQAGVIKLEFNSVDRGVTRYGQVVEKIYYPNGTSKIVKVLDEWVIRHDVNEKPWEMWKADKKGKEKKRWQLVDEKGNVSFWVIGKDGHLCKEE